jgi:hypothetical protein
METFLEYLSLISLLAGLGARVLVPWLAVRQQNPDGAVWDWRFVWPQVLSFVILILMLPLLVEDLAGIHETPAQAAWLLGWGAGDVGRKAYKVLVKEVDEPGEVE